MSIETIFDTQVLEQGKREELITVSSIAQKCLNYKGGIKRKEEEVDSILTLVQIKINIDLG